MSSVPVGELIVKLRAESAVFTQNMDKARQTTAKTHATFLNFSEGGSRGFRRLETAAFSLTTGMAGLHGEVGRVAEGFLLLGVSGPIMDGIIIALAATGALYEKLTEKTRKAKEETDKFIESQLKAARLRADPNADVSSGLGQLQKRRQELIDDIRSRQANQSGVTNALDPFGMFGKQLAGKQNDLKETLNAIAAAQGSVSEKGFELIKNLSMQATTFGMDTYAAQKLAITMDGSLSPTVRKGALALLDYLEKLDKQKKAHEAAAEAAKKHKAELDRLNDALLAKQHAERVANAAGQGNFTPGMGGTNTGPLNGGLLSGATADQITDSRAKDVMDRLAERAAVFRDAWMEAAQDVRNAFLDAFMRIGERGYSLTNLLKDLAHSVQKLLANIASGLITNAIFRGLGLPFQEGAGVGSIGRTRVVGVGHAGGMVGSLGRTRVVDPSLFIGARRYHSGGLIGSDEVPIIAQRGERIIPRGGSVGGGGTVVHVSQNISFGVSAMDGPSVDRFFKENGGRIAGSVLDAAARAPGFARYIVAQGAR